MKSKSDPHVDWSRFGKKPRKQINSEAAQEKKSLGLSGHYARFRVHVNGNAYDIPLPDVRAIRERLHLSQAAFAERFCLSHRTVQQWEQHRATPDMPARILLKVIERAPDVVAKAAADAKSELKPVKRRT